MSFTDDPWVQVEAFIDGAWVDVTADTDDDDGGSRISGSKAVTITRGQSIDAQRANPGECDFTIFQRDGKYSNRNPRSPYFGKLGINTPVRVKALPYESHIRFCSYEPHVGVLALDSATLDITGDIELRVEFEAERLYEYKYVALTKYTSGGDQRSWFLWLINGYPEFIWSTAGTAGTRVFAESTAPLPEGRVSLKVTLDVNNGSGQSETKFFYSTNGIDGTYTQLGSTLFAGTTSIYSGTADVVFGAVSDSGLGISDTNNPSQYFQGKLYGFRIYNGIGGTLRADADFRSLEMDDTSYSDGTTTFSINEPAFVESDSLRFYGYIPRWPVLADSGNKNVYTPVKAYGLFQQMNTGALSLDSPMRRYYVSVPGIVGYWPGEDGSDALNVSSITPGVNPARAVNVEFAAESTLPGSLPLLTITDNSSVQGRFLPYTSTGKWTFTFAIYMNQAPAVDVYPISLVLSNGYRVLFKIGTFTYATDVYDNAGTLVSNANTLFGTGAEPGQWMFIVFEFTQDGSAVDWITRWRTTDPTVGYSHSNTIAATTLGKLASWNITGLASGHGLSTCALGHFAGSNDTGDFGQGAHLDSFRAYVGESDVERISRLASEQNRLLRVIGREGRGVRMGPQRVATELDLYTDCADVGRGLLMERRDSAELIYFSRAQLERYSPRITDYSLALSATADDDLIPINLVTVTRDNGGSYTSETVTGPNATSRIGTLGQPFTLNLYEDAQTQDLANDIRRTGSWDELRWFDVEFELAKPLIADNLVRLDALRSIDLGQALQLTGLPDFLPVRDPEIAVIAYTEVLSRFLWSLVINTKPARPLRTVSMYDLLSRVGSSASTLTSDIDAAVTSFSVTGSTYTAWKYSTDCYISVSDDKEKMLVTGITGTGPWTFTVIRGTEAFTHDAGASVRLWDQRAISYGTTD